MKKKEFLFKYFELLINNSQRNKFFFIKDLYRKQGNKKI